MNHSICFSCCESKILTEEHIIPQALGGKLSDFIYCKDCNDKFGREIDSELIRNIHYFSTSLNVKRKRGKNKPYEVTSLKDGTKLIFNGKHFRRKSPEIIKEMDGDKLKFLDVRAGSEKELFRKISEIKKKHKLDGEVEIRVERRPGPTDTKIEFTFDNSLIRRAVAKIAYGFICIRLHNFIILSPSFNEIRNYIRFGDENNLASPNYRYTGFMTDHIRPLHRIHITLNRLNNIIIGFVSLFGTFRYTVLLSRSFISSVDWSGLDYTFDPVTGKEIFIDPHFIAPELNINEVLFPRQSRNLVLSELKKGHKIIENYVKDRKLIEINTEP